MAVIYNEDDPVVSVSHTGPRLMIARPSRPPRDRARWGLLFAVVVSAGMWAAVIGLVVKLAGRI